MLLKDGIEKFKRDILPTHASLFEALRTGQAPEVLFITCSDSRIDPSLITQTQPGELFIVRNAGNLVPAYGDDDGTASAVEYAVAALGVKHIVVCGHSGCGAITGLLNPTSLTSLPKVAAWVSHAQGVAEAVQGLPEHHKLPTAIQHNVFAQLDNLRTHPAVASALEAGRLELHGWLYDIGAGEVTDLTPQVQAA